jgi:hypothetical protein
MEVTISVIVSLATPLAQAEGSGVHARSNTVVHCLWAILGEVE